MAASGVNLSGFDVCLGTESYGCKRCATTAILTKITKAKAQEITQNKTVPGRVPFGTVSVNVKDIPPGLRDELTGLNTQAGCNTTS